MDKAIELLKISLPAIIVCYAVYLIVRTFVLKELEKIKLEQSFKNTETILPIRMQAYERMCLFLERIAPGNIIPRLNAAGLTARELQTIILRDIREEFNHNLSQQIYMSDKAWSSVRLAMETNISLINEAADALFLNIATREDLDLAMTKGVNYPKGLLAWADELGIEVVLKQLEALHLEYGEDRYRPSPQLRRMARSGAKFF